MLKSGVNLKIGLNATCFNSRPSGANQRFAGIYGELIKRLPETEFFVYEPKDCDVGSWFDGASNVSIRQTPLPSVGRVRRYIGGVGYWAQALQKEDLDVFESFNLPSFRVSGVQTVLTVHDIRRMYSEYGFLERTAFKAALRKSFSMVDRVIAVSQSMKDEILTFYPDVPITVVHNGLDSQGFDNPTAADQQAFQDKFALPADFLLAVGHLEKRKNYLRLIDAVAQLRDRGHFYPLVIIGNDSGERKSILERIASHNLTDQVILLTGLSDMEVRCAYKLCGLFVFPSSYEGFGIPILEAMAARRPMILSDIPVFREITQGQGVYFPHDNVELMALAIENVLSSSSESERLTKYGAERVKDFGFTKLATQIEGLYKSMAL